MITIISCTNRSGAKTHAFAEYAAATLRDMTEETVHYISLEDIQGDILHADMYNPDAMKPELRKLQDEAIIPTHKFVFVCPEYNGSYPGILKLFLDAISIRNYKANFVGKKALLIGIASGRAGNLRGIDHLTGVLHHVGVAVSPFSSPISSIGTILDERRQVNEATRQIIQSKLEAFLAF